MSLRLPPPLERSISVTSLFTSPQVECVDLAALFNRIPKTRAATGDDALRQVLTRLSLRPTSLATIDDDHSG